MYDQCEGRLEAVFNCSSNIVYVSLLFLLTTFLQTFQKARALAPSILFLDEIDSIVGKRSESTSSSGVSERVLSALLNEMDGVGVRFDDKTDSKAVEEESTGRSQPQQQSQLKQVLYHLETGIMSVTVSLLLSISALCMCDGLFCVHSNF